MKNLLKTLKILIVEDEKKLASLLKESILDTFFKVIIAKDGDEGLKKYHSFKPDIIITDIMMPFCDGLEMTQKIKELDENIPIIVLSAHSDKEKLLKAIDLGINKYFIKPFEPDELISYINKIVLKLQKEKKVLLKEDFIFDNNSLSLYKNNTLIELTKREKEFFFFIIKNKNNLVLTQTLKDKLWEKNISDEVLRTFIKRVRLKTSKELIENISAQGYLISVLNS